MIQSRKYNVKLFLPVAFVNDILQEIVLINLRTAYSKLWSNDSFTMQRLIQQTYIREKR